MTTDSNQRKLIFALLLAMTLPFFSAVVYFVFLKESIFAQVVYSVTKVFTLLWPLIVYKIVLKTKLPAFSLWRWSLSDLIIGVVSGIAISAIGLLLANSVLHGLVESSAPRIIAKVNQLGIREHYLIFALFLSIVHSLIEEYYWRWFVYGSLTELTTEWRAHLYAGFAFASHHVVILSQFFPLSWAIFFGLAVAVGGVIWSLMYSRSGSLAGAWISHALVDMGVMSIGYQIINV